MSETQRVFWTEHAATHGVVTGDMWTPPDLQCPLRGTVVLILGDDGSVRYGKYDAQGWSAFPSGVSWSNACPGMVGWKYANWPAKTETEQKALTG